MTTKQIKQALARTLLTIQISCRKDENGEATYTVRKGFFYSHGQTSQNLADAIAAAIPGVTILDAGRVDKPFRGGAGVAKNSHFWVKFQVHRENVSAN